MRKLRSGLPILLLVMCTTSCGAGEPDSASPITPEGPSSGSASEPGEISAQTNEMVSPAAVAACGGFTLNDAANVLGVPATGLEDRSEASSHSLNLCSFLISGSMEGVGFYLSVSDTVQRAVVEMEQGRGMAGFAQTTIDEATGTQSQNKALESENNIGDEAYFMEVNGTLNVRVGNVQIQVFHLEDREQMKEVGRIVAAGLRQS